MIKLYLHFSWIVRWLLNIEPKKSLFVNNKFLIGCLKARKFIIHRSHYLYINQDNHTVFIHGIVPFSYFFVVRLDLLISDCLFFLITFIYILVFFKYGFLSTMQHNVSFRVFVSDKNSLSLQKLCLCDVLESH
jgi:hypothetical protein